ncbi:MAG: hypothetical protein U9R00_01020 [Patescibacteria group bacterium]|nr:hypothetical protein [Patescibacteria group bacterium]
MKKILFYFILVLITSNVFSQNENPASFWFLPLENVVERIFVLEEQEYYDLLVVKLNEDSSLYIEKHVFIEVEKNEKLLVTGPYWIQANKMIWDGSNWIKFFNISEDLKSKQRKKPQKYPVLDLVCNWGKQNKLPGFKKYKKIVTTTTTKVIKSSGGNKKSNKSPGYNLVK